MKKLINRPADVVSEMLEGLSLAYPGMRQLPGHSVLVRTDAEEIRNRNVALISGGGSGHEPAHAGYVGQGMLSGSVSGDVFTSPTPDAILAAIRAVTGPPGCLLIVKNYTGDRLNFGLAAELARTEGLAVELVVVADDVALAESADNAGRRGLAGTILVHKVAGAAAESGASLSEVTREARAVIGSVRTMGVGLSPCTVPAAGRPGFDIGPDEVELGLGIHGEPGVRRIPLEAADSLVDRLLNPIRADLALGRGERVALLVNGLGGTPAMEMAIVARHAITQLEGAGIPVERVYIGEFLTSLEMAGVSLSVLRLDDRRLSRLDAPTVAPAWPNAANRARSPQVPRFASVVPTSAVVASGPPITALGRSVESALRRVASALLEAAPRLNDLDREVGDGDLGTSLARGATTINERLGSYPLDDPPSTLLALGLDLQRALGGTSGPLYAVFCLRAGQRLAAAGVACDSPRAWADAFSAGCAAISELGGAAAGDRTMLDAILPAATAFRAAVDFEATVTEALRRAADAAAKGSQATAQMRPRRGRSSYLGERALGQIDPGAEAVAIATRALVAT
jgi:triose/dihydroxyacetone kinase / FAD-AMP lyase (cyclizing)